MLFSGPLPANYHHRLEEIITMTSTTTADTKRHYEFSSAGFIPVALAVLSVLTLIVSFFSIIAGVAGVILLIASTVVLIAKFRAPQARKVLATALVAATLSIITATTGLFLQLSNAQTHCSHIAYRTSPGYVSCFQDNYSPWKGAFQALTQ